MSDLMSMTADEFRAACAKLGLSQVRTGRVIGISPRQAQNFAAYGAEGQPPVMSLKLLLMLPKDKRDRIVERRLRETEAD